MRVIKKMVICQERIMEEELNEQILKDNPYAEPYVDFYPPCEGCMSRKGGYNDCPEGR